MTSAAPTFSILPIEKYSLTAELASHIGDTAAVFAQLHAYHIPLPKMFIVPRDFFVRIEEHNHFSRLMDVAVKLRADNRAAITQMSQDIQDAVLHFAIPEDVVRALNVTYTESLEHVFLRMTPSFLTEDTIGNEEEVAVIGEANLVESLLKLWAKLYRLPYWQQRMSEWQEKKMVPAAFMLQEMANADASGYAFNAHAQHKHLITVMAQRGVARSADPESFDRFEVDAHTAHVQSQHITYKADSAKLEPDHLHLISLAEHQRSEPAITTQDIAHIVDLFEQVRKKMSPRIEMTWSLINGKPLVTSVRILPAAVVLPKPTTTSTIKVLLTVTEPAQLEHELTEPVDGIGVLKSEDLLWPLHEHPQHVLRTERSTVVKHTIEHALTQCHTIKPDAPIFFRSLNATTTELATLQHGKELEPHEENPYLGYRGAIRALHNTDLFDTELAALSETWQKTKQSLTMVLPFVRTVSELALLQKHATQKLSSVPVELWMQCNTPENIFQIGQYAKLNPAGFVIHINTIHALMHGISPDDDHIFKLYHFDPTLLYLLLSTVHTQLRWSPARVMVCMETYSTDVVELCQQLGFWGITVNAGDVRRVREALEKNN